MRVIDDRLFMGNVEEKMREEARDDIRNERTFIIEEDEDVPAALRERFTALLDEIAEARMDRYFAGGPDA